MALSIPNISEVKTAARDAMKLVFDTWARDTQIRIYKSEKKTFTVVDPNYRHSLGGNQNNTITTTPTYDDFTARIIYINPGDLTRSLSGGAPTVFQGNQTIKVQFELDGHTYLEGAERVTFLSEKFKMVGDVQKIGIMGDPQFYQYVFEAVS